jgi:two-component system CheB/CheR fusion protein
VDFTTYKRTTIARRLERQLALHRLPTIDAYAQFLAEHPEAARGLYEDLLIHVTEFFRDPSTLDEVTKHVIPALLETESEDPIRAWIPGCSTGEEAYSLAMLLLEARGARQVQIFATDLSETAIEIAREGHYSDGIAERIGRARLERFFTRSGDGWRVGKELRECCLFVRHDLAADPPFSRIDLISCRNVLIYLGPDLQKRLIQMFHSSLNQPGFLVLGRAETVMGLDALFGSVARGEPVFARKPGPRSHAIGYANGRRVSRRHGEPATRPDVRRDADHVLLARYAPASVLIDANHEIIQFRGRTGAYLEPTPGPPQTGVIEMAREGLRPDLRCALARAAQDRVAVRSTCTIRGETGPRRVAFEVIPLLGVTPEQTHFLIVFEEADAVAARFSAAEEERVVLIEELQASNDELERVNGELAESNRSLHHANDDLVNVLASVDIAIIIVDAERRLRRYTPRARDVFKLIQTDIGRPIGDLKPSVTVDDFDAAISEAIDSLAIVEREVRDTTGAIYRMQIRPYRTVDNKISGAIVSFVDVTGLHELVHETRLARDHANAIIETTPAPLLVLDGQLRVHLANRAAGELFEMPLAEMPGTAVHSLGVGRWREPDLLRSKLVTAIATQTAFDELEIEYSTRAGDRHFVASARALAGSNPPLVLLGLVDATQQRRQATRREREALLNAISHELRTPLNAILLWAQVLADLDLHDARLAQGIETIVHSTRAEVQLIDDLVEVAFAHRRVALVVKREWIDPAGPIAAAVDAMRAEADAKRVALHTELRGNMRIYADPRRLQQITWSLIGNAIKFTPSKGRIDVALTPCDGGVELRIDDTGTGIERALLGKIFEPFSQQDMSTTRVHAGLGIGLSLVRELVDRHGGTITASSAGSDHGATFTVRLPSAAELD